MVAARHGCRLEDAPHLAQQRDGPVRQAAGDHGLPDRDRGRPSGSNGQKTTTQFEAARSNHLVGAKVFTVLMSTGTGDAPLACSADLLAAPTRPRRARACVAPPIVVNMLAGRMASPRGCVTCSTRAIRLEDCAIF